MFKNFEKKTKEITDLSKVVETNLNIIEKQKNEIEPEKVIQNNISSKQSIDNFLR